MLTLFWRMLARLLARTGIAAWLITRAQRTPYLHIRSADGREVYMGRWWLFNAYDRATHLGRSRWCPWSIRVHHIMRPDADRDMHDHPWNARTFILRKHHDYGEMQVYVESQNYAWEFKAIKDGYPLWLTDFHADGRCVIATLANPTFASIAINTGGGTGDCPRSNSTHRQLREQKPIG